MAGAPIGRLKPSAFGRSMVSFVLLLLMLVHVIAGRHSDSTSQGAAGFDHAGLLLPVIPSDSAREVSNTHRFSLRHVFHHGTFLHPNLHRRLDIKKDAPIIMSFDDGESEEAPPLVARSRSTEIHRMKDRSPATIRSLLDSSRQTGYVAQLSPSAWSLDSTSGPNMTDKETVLTMAQMTANAYARDHDSSDWQDLGWGLNNTEDFGWESDGLRGHVYADETEKTIVIGIKGTTKAVYDGDGTTTNDKVNDNLFGSCCCAQQGQWTWKQVCDCATSAYTCNQTCLVSALRNESRYYSAVLDLYSNVTALYPESNVWLTGHSLGGVVSSLLGLTYGLPTVTFEAVPDSLAADRLGLPSPPGVPGANPRKRPFTGIYQVGHTADPVYMGSCNGATSTCSFAGYAFEAQCHTGKSCTYDVVKDKGWRVSITTHGIKGVISNVIKAYDTVPKCEETPECEDCYLWNFYESHNRTEGTTTQKPTSTAKSTTRTRTETCKTPGWWGCLDEPSTATSDLSTTTTSTTTTSTCKTPGWFGCKDEKTTLSTSSRSSSSSTSLHTPTITKPPSMTTSTSITSKVGKTSSSCETPGWWGCKDETTTMSVTPSAPASKTLSPTSCSTKGWFGCKDAKPKAQASWSFTEDL